MAEFPRSRDPEDGRIYEIQTPVFHTPEGAPTSVLDLHVEAGLVIDAMRNFADIFPTLAMHADVMGTLPDLRGASREVVAALKREAASLERVITATLIDTSDLPHHRRSTP